MDVGVAWLLARSPSTIVRFITERIHSLFFMSPDKKSPAAGEIPAQGVWQKCDFCYLQRSALLPGVGQTHSELFCSVVQASAHHQFVPWLMHTEPVGDAWHGQSATKDGKWCLRAIKPADRLGRTTEDREHHSKITCPSQKEISSESKLDSKNLGQIITLRFPGMRWVKLAFIGTCTILENIQCQRSRLRFNCKKPTSASANLNLPHLGQWISLRV